jgi:hypothetical protein
MQRLRVTLLVGIPLLSGLDECKSSGVEGKLLQNDPVEGGVPEQTIYRNRALIPGSA